MKIKQTVKNVTLAIALGAGLITTLAPTIASAITTTTCPDPQNPGQEIACVGNNNCGVDTAILQCDNVEVGKPGIENNLIWSLLLTTINILSAGIGLAALGGIVYGSILYTTAAGNAEQVKKALEFIRNVVIGLVAYALMFALLNFIIPGGLFSS